MKETKELGDWKKKFVWKQNYMKLLLNWKKKTARVKPGGFIFILVLPPPLPLSFVSLFTTLLRQVTTKYRLW